MEGSVLEQQIKVFNRSKNTVSCQYSHLFDPNLVLRNDTNIIKVYNVLIEAAKTKLFFRWLGKTSHLVSCAACYDDRILSDIYTDSIARFTDLS